MIYFNADKEIWRLNLSDSNPTRFRSKSWKMHGEGVAEKYDLVGVDKLCFRGIRKLIQGHKIVKPILFVI